MSFNTDIMLLSMSYIQVLSTGPVMFFFFLKKKNCVLYWHIADWCIRIAESLCCPLETITIITITITTSTALPLSPCNLISCHTHTHLSNLKITSDFKIFLKVQSLSHSDTSERKYRLKQITSGMHSNLYLCISIRFTSQRPEPCLTILLAIVQWKQSPWAILKARFSSSHNSLDFRVCRTLSVSCIKPSGPSSHGLDGTVLWIWLYHFLSQS